MVTIIWSKKWNVDDSVAGALCIPPTKPIDITYIGGSGFRLVLGQDSAHQLSVVDVLQAVTGRTNLLVHLVTATDRGVVESGQQTVVTPRQFGTVRLHLGGKHRHGQTDNTGCGETADQRHSGPD